MIVSYHPLFEADHNIICAGREPDADDLAAIRAAKAVILGQGCYRSLYEMARANCPNVFPNYDARFGYPGKIGQTRLFRNFDVCHPKTKIFQDVASFQTYFNHKPNFRKWRYPYVLKLDWGGEGETVYFVASDDHLKKILQQTTEYEESGQCGFLVQKYVPSNNRSLRVVAVGRQYHSYWRIQKNTAHFHTSLSKGAVIDSQAQPDIQHKAVAVVKKLCQNTGINLAGFDVIFSSEVEDPEPMLLEINYFFGRKGLGGSEAYYKILQEQIQSWLDLVD